MDFILKDCLQQEGCYYELCQLQNGNRSESAGKTADGFCLSLDSDSVEKFQLPCNDTLLQRFSAHFKSLRSQKFLFTLAGYDIELRHWKFQIFKVGSRLLSH